MNRPALSLLGSALALAAVLGATSTARAEGECEVASDCGHGFDCVPTVTSPSGRDDSGAGGAMGGTGGAMGSGAPAFAAGTGSTGSGGTVPVSSFTCGNRLCEQPFETPESCVSDCIYYNFCSLAECTSASDCAEGYSCPQAVLPGTGGGPNAPACGDGLCTSGETADSCPDDCLVTRHCTPESGFCTSDTDCAPDFYCNFMGTGGASGTAGTGSGSGGASTGGSGPSAGGAGGMADGDAAFAPPPAGSSGTGGEAGEAAGVPERPAAGGSSGIIAAGTCMPNESGEGGSSGTGMSVGGGPATGGASNGGEPNGGVGTAGTVPAAGTGQGGTGTSGTTSTGGAGETDPGSGARGGGSEPGSSGGSEATGGNPATSDGDSDSDEVVVTHGGCSVARSSNGSSFGAFALLALGLARLGRRRRAA